VDLLKQFRLAFNKLFLFSGNFYL